MSTPTPSFPIPSYSSNSSVLNTNAMVDVPLPNSPSEFYNQQCNPHLNTTRTVPLMSQSNQSSLPMPRSFSALDANSIINVALLNVRSLRNKCCHIRDFIIDNNLHVFCIVESWLKDSDSSVIASFLPNTHVLHHFTRPMGRGGGVGVILSKNFQNIKSFNRFNDTFECIELHATCHGTKLVFSVIYRPPTSEFFGFIQELEKYVLECEKYNKNVFYVGDFNIWMDNVERAETRKMNSFLEAFSLKNYVASGTHRYGHTLDLVITNKNSSLITDVLVDSATDLISDHKPIFFGIKLHLKHKVFKNIKFRKINSNFPEYLCNNLNFSLFSNSVLCVHLDLSCITCYVDLFRQISRDIFDSYCPSVEKTIQIFDDSCKWFNIDVLNAKRNLRKAEKNSKTVVPQKIVKTTCACVI